MLFRDKTLKPALSSSIVHSLLLLLLAGLTSGACRKPAPAFDTAAHKQEIEEWQSTRLAGLKKEDSWLSLVGLFWLHEGENKFGSDPKNTVVLPRDKAPADAGSLWLEKGTVRLQGNPRVPISVTNSAIGDVTLNERAVGTFDLKDDTEDGGPSLLRLGTLLLNVVKRGERIGIRVKDTASRTRQEFKGLDYYPIDPKWRVEARFEPYQPPKMIPITNVLGMTDNETSPGALAFEVGGKTYRLDPILEKGERDYFVMIADETTDSETYGAGRYIYVPPPDASGKVIIDFNKAYSPPCAFTNFATCPLPPKQNHLALRIDAGEKKYTGTVH